MFGRPIWITEMSVAKWEADGIKKFAYPQADVYEFMKKLLPELEKRSYVERYSWKQRDEKSIPMSTSTLITDDGKSLTELGKLYMST